MQIINLKWFKNLLDIITKLFQPESDDNVIDALIEEDMLMAVSSDGELLTDEDDNILIW